MAAELTEQKAVIAFADHGSSRLRIETIEQGKSPRQEGNYAINIIFRLEFPQGAPPVLLTQCPADIFLETEGSPLVAARTSAGKILPLIDSGWVEETGSIVQIHGLEVGSPQDCLRDVELAVTLVKVTEWEELKFEKLGLGQSDFLRCGPFDLRVNGERKSVSVEAGAYTQFREEHEAYRTRVPLHFLNHLYALNHLSVIDASGRKATQSSVSFTGGAGAGTFLHFRLPANRRMQTENVSPARNDEDEIAYPLSVALRLPKRYEKEKLTFHFDEIALPPPK